MSQITESFFDYSKSIAENFLTTAVVVDDKANFGSTVPVNPEKLLPLKSRKGKDAEVIDDFEKHETNNHIKTDSSHDLNAKQIIQSFAEKKIVCSVIKPEKTDYETINGTIEKLSQSSDLLIFDWQLYDGTGDKTLELIKETINASINFTPQQLRLIVVYTGEHDVKNIADKINATLKSIDSSDIISEEGGLIQRIGACKIVILIKENVHVPEEYSTKKVSSVDLADRLISEFTLMTFGLLSNVAMESISKIRQNTNKIIAKFSSDLDAPYLTHRVCLAHPEDSEELAEILVSREIDSILKECSIGQIVNDDILGKWVKWKIENGTIFKRFDVAFDEDKLVDLIKNGITSGNNQISNKNGFKTLTVLFSNDTDPNKAEELDLNFAKMVTIQTHYSGNTPILTLGTIIKNTCNDNQEKYWICIQPRCDCVRIKESICFPFLPLLDTPFKNSIHVVVPQKDNKLKRFRIPKKPSLSKMIAFKANEDCEKVLAKKNGDRFEFEDVDVLKYEWIGELKPEFAQNIANSFANEISRVGTDNSEWLRRWEAKDND